MINIGTYKNGYTIFENNNTDLKNAIIKLASDISDDEKAISVTNRKYDAGKEFTKQYCPIFNHQECITSLNGEGDSVKTDGRDSVSIEISNNITNCYSIKIVIGCGSACIFFNRDGNFVTRDYNHDINYYNKIESVEKYYAIKITEFLDIITNVFKNQSNLDYIINKNGEHVWFTTEFAYKTNSYALQNNIPMLEKFPYQHTNKFFKNGESARGITKPKKVSVVSNTTPTDILKILIESILQKNNISLHL